MYIYIIIERHEEVRTTFLQGCITAPVTMEKILCAIKGHSFESTVSWLQVLKVSSSQLLAL